MRESNTLNFLFVLDDDMDIDIDMDEASKPNTSKEDMTRRNDISERVKELTVNANTMDVANERSLDWIWSVVGQLRLKSVIANDMLLAKDGNLQGPTSDFDLSSAMSQRLVVGNIMAQVKTQKNTKINKYGFLIYIVGDASISKETSK